MHLETLSRGPEASLYAIHGAHQSPVHRYLLSTPDGRRIVNDPSLVGVDFTCALRRAVSAGLGLLPDRDAILSSPQERVCVVHFLRGGLNFGLRDAAAEAFGLNRHSSCFMSSQRRRIDGRWLVEEDMYRKLHIPPQAILLIGDVVATGLTVDNGLQVIIEHVKQLGTSIRRIVFFTIGCHKIEKVLARHDTALREAFPEYEGASAIYLEAKFRLVDSRTPLRIREPGTDLVRRFALHTPELALSQLEDLAAALERCAIYDAGSRAFDLPTYLADVREYWEQVAQLAEEGVSLAEWAQERWPLGTDDTGADFATVMRSQWPDLDPTLHKQLLEAYARRQDRLRGEAGSARALRHLALGRLETLTLQA
ncbi:MAG: hypothetical protein RBU37_05900 [Myxococcota bacterium]|jgi:hypothetical protein|nr:hypothetical protein [Myxococcota bacterium]